MKSFFAIISMALVGAHSHHHKHHHEHQAHPTEFSPEFHKSFAQQKYGDVTVTIQRVMSGLDNLAGAGKSDPIPERYSQNSDDVLMNMLITGKFAKPKPSDLLAINAKAAQNLLDVDLKVTVDCGCNCQCCFG